MLFDLFARKNKIRVLMPVGIIFLESIVNINSAMTPSISFFMPTETQIKKKMSKRHET